MTGDARLFVLGSLVVACTATVGRLPSAGETLAADGFLIELGGKGLNQAVGAVRLGAAVDGLFAIGDDPLSTFAERAFGTIGLSTAMLVRHPGTTGGGVGIIDAAGENVIAVHAGANAKLCAEDVLAAATRIVQAQVVTAQFEVSDAAIAACLALAKSAGATTLLNPSPYRSLDAGILSYVDYVVVNETEAARLAAESGVPIERLADALSGLRGAPVSVVLTRGSKGAACICVGSTVHQTAFAVQAQDCIGAGDAFLAGFAVALARGATVAEALRDGAGCGAIVASRCGVLSALPLMNELRTFVAGHENGRSFGRLLDDLEPNLTRNGDDADAFAQRFKPRPSEVTAYLADTLDSSRGRKPAERLAQGGVPV